MTFCKVYIKDASSMAEVESNSIQLAITSLPDAHIIPPPELRQLQGDQSRHFLLNRHFLVKSLYPYLSSMINEIYRVLKDDGLFFLNVGSPVRWYVLSGYQVLHPYILAEYIMFESKLQLRRDFVANVDPSTLTAVAEEAESKIVSSNEHLLMFSKGDRWKMNVDGEAVLTTSIYFKREMHPVVKKWVEKGVMPSMPFAKQITNFVLEIFTDEGDTVLDPCAGIGTLAEDALKKGRNAVLYEINPAYVPLIMENLPDAEIIKPTKADA